MGKIKKLLQKEFVIDGVSTTDNTNIFNSFCNYFIDLPKNVHESIPVSDSHHLDKIDINDRSIYFRQATETKNVESIMELNIEGCKNDVPRKFLTICKNQISYYLRRTIKLLY